MLAALPLVFLASLTGQAQAPAPSPNPSLIRVFVATEDTGEARELADRRVSVTDLAAAFASKKKSVVIVDKEEAADVVVEVVRRDTEVPKVVFGIGPRAGDPVRTTEPTRTGKLRVTLMFGQMAVNLTNKNRTNDHPRGWKSAAEDVADQVDKWISQFRGEIIRAR